MTLQEEEERQTSIENKKTQEQKRRENQGKLVNQKWKKHPMKQIKKENNRTKMERYEKYHQLCKQEQKDVRSSK